MRFYIAVFAVLAMLAQVFAFPQPAELSDPALQEQLMGRLYRNILYRNTKRSPSIGLSLAEYMASPQGQDNFHFIPSGRN
uniref:Uncharacterized protein n=1 Tax=Ditylenchus dipsaci TaxID=166011 RepID=A0A915D4U4_9BILA